MRSPPAPSGSTTGGSAQENYSFTPAGVLASTTDGVIDYHNTLPVKVGRTTYTYDAAGRITRTVTKRLGKKPLVHHFFYATGEQPIGFSSSDAPGVGYRYTYDGLGRRVAKDTINTTTGEVIHRDVFTHTGNQLAAVTTTIDTTDPARVGEGYVWTTDPATGETHGQITLTNGTGDANDTPANPAAGWSQARVDATFYALVCDLAGAPQELINTTTGVIEGHTTQTLYGTRTWSGRCTSPLLFAGQYEDVESGWAYNRFRYYNPTLGAYNAQDPLGLAPRLASAQGYVDHAAYWVDVFGLKACPNLNGGRYKDLTAKDLEGNKYERHHLISSHALKETKAPKVSDSKIHREGICVRLTPEEHAETNNFGPGKKANLQRQHEVDMIQSGRRNELMSEQIRDVQNITTERDEGLLQAWLADRARPDWKPDRLF